MSELSEDELPVASDNEEGDDLFEQLADDYREIAVLDEYDGDGLDQSTYDVIDAGQRRAAERVLNERDRRAGRRRFAGAVPTALDEDDDFGAITLEERRELLISQGGLEPEEEAGVNLDDYQGPVRQYLEQENVQKEVKRRFSKFLTSFRDPKQKGPKYMPMITQMCRENGSSLQVSYMDLSQAATTTILAIWLIDVPSKLLALFDEVAMDVALFEFEAYDAIHPHIHVRIKKLPLVDQIRDLRGIHLNAFVQVVGVVTRRTNVFPQLLLVKFDCLNCGFIIGPLTQVGSSEVRPRTCPDCQRSGPFRLNESQTIYRNYQKLVLQEPPGSVPAGRIPRSREVICVDDLCDFVRPGEQIKVTGTYKHVYNPGMNAMQGFPVFNTVIEANHILREKDYYSQYIVTDTDKAEILKLSKLPDIETKIINSIAPSIYGYEYIKRALAYALLSGQEKKHKNKHRVRGDINVLILGDPGVAKSQFLRYVEKLACRAVYATGKGASAVGLTASVRRDPITSEWTLEGGALVLADRGVCLIDEFDKMNEADRTSIHEAMEQQSISISKAGIVATLQARCAVIAAANPLKGRYDGSLTFLENVDLTDPILSRFDVLAVVRDRVDPVRDEQLADFVVSSHMASHPAVAAAKADDGELDDDEEKVGENQVSQAMLRKYIVYAKSNCHPKLDQIDQNKIAKFYADLRQKSIEGGGIPIAVRHIESILRCSEARAKMHLREYVNESDVDTAIAVMLESFIATQKQSVQASLKAYFKHYLNLERDSTELLLHILEEEVMEEVTHRRLALLGTGVDAATVTDSAVEIDRKLFEQKADALNVTTSLAAFFKAPRFKEEGFAMAKRGTVIVKSFR